MKNCAREFRVIFCRFDRVFFAKLEVRRFCALLSFERGAGVSSRRSFPRGGLCHADGLAVAAMEVLAQAAQAHGHEEAGACCIGALCCSLLCARRLQVLTKRLCSFLRRVTVRRHGDRSVKRTTGALAVPPAPAVGVLATVTQHRCTSNRPHAVRRCWS